MYILYIHKLNNKFVENFYLPEVSGILSILLKLSTIYKQLVKLLVR